MGRLTLRVPDELENELEYLGSDDKDYMSAAEAARDGIRRLCDEKIDRGEYLKWKKNERYSE